MIKYKLSDPRCEPKVGSTTAAGADLRYYFYSKDETAMREIKPGETMLVGTGVCAQIPDGWVGLVAPRSSTGKLKIMLTNTLGVIDSDYRGEIKISIYNYGTEPQVINNFDRAVQIVYVPHMAANAYEIVSELEDTERGSGGFGSTGKS